MDASDPEIGIASGPGESELAVVDNNEVSQFPQINTDNLPITPLRSKPFQNQIMSICPKEAKRILEMTPLHKPPPWPPQLNTIDNTYFSIVNDISEDSKTIMPNTDNLLNINIPKTTLLGKQQAKKRLQAFSLSKQATLMTSPLVKKVTKQPKQNSEDKSEELVEKAGGDKIATIKKPPKKSESLLQK